MSSVFDCVRAPAAAAILAVAAALPCAAQCQLAKLVAADAGTDDLFGRRVALDGPLALIGAHLHDRPATGGAAYVFRGTGPEWKADSELVGGTLAYRGLGGSVALLDGVALAGSIGDGVVLVFAQVGDGSWQFEEALRGDDVEELDFFGWSVAYDGWTVVVGAPEDSNVNGGDAGSVYVFERDPNGIFVQTAKLIASDGTAGDAFGLSLAVKGDTIVVGAPEDDPFGFASGSAYVFERDGSCAWRQTAKLLPDTGTSLQAFGDGVAVGEHGLLVGAHGDPAAAPRGGAAYVFERGAAGDWIQVQRLTAPSAENSDFFGISVAMDGGLAIVGARNYTHEPFRSGAAFVYDRQPGGLWQYVGALVGEERGNGDQFGRSVALSGHLAVVGAPYHDVITDDGEVLEDAGAAYVFAVGPDLDGDGIMDACICPGDVNGDFNVNFTDLATVLDNFGQVHDDPAGGGGDPDPACQTWPTRCLGDLDRDGDVDISDLGILLANWGSVCP